MCFKQMCVKIDNSMLNRAKMERNDQTQGFFGQFLDYPISVWIVQTASRLYCQSLDCPDNF